MAIRFFSVNEDKIKYLAITAMHGYRYAYDQLQQLAINDAYAAYNLALVYIHANKLLNAQKYLEHTIDLEEKLPVKTFTLEIKTRYKHLIDTRYLNSAEFQLRAYP